MKRPNEGKLETRIVAAFGCLWALIALTFAAVPVLLIAMAYYLVTH